MKALLLALSIALTTSVAQAGPKVALDTNRGTIVLELDDKAAPVTTENFLQYVRDGFYNGVIFHRVIPGFMIQGGGFEPGMKQKSTRAPIKNEAKNGLSNLTGSIAMARTQDPHSASAQFFINLVDNTKLDYPSFDGWGYAVFGKVVEGMDVVKTIGGTPTGAAAGHRDVPTEDIIIRAARELPADGK
ncbi:peptidylprolyl isomerase [Denitromonas iodatirespirans]|uniref:Peptidyl-prolyl cis-trans isomerase n=1 Tax=Denitromonas iodatirespirans TaxID=2795389 RepID=A0A944H726_DENI1|nr:peptidylprolyl isomerase [Denitromonas iodatirespirans]MBT0960773.1 peptidyl-prolyl cis-trans isomerase [Denitromonas iodatirespirans]